MSSEAPEKEKLTVRHLIADSLSMNTLAEIPAAELLQLEAGILHALAAVRADLATKGDVEQLGNGVS